MTMEDFATCGPVPAAWKPQASPTTTVPPCTRNRPCTRLLFLNFHPHNQRCGSLMIRHILPFPTKVANDAPLESVGSCAGTAVKLDHCSLRSERATCLARAMTFARLESASGRHTRSRGKAIFAALGSLSRPPNPPCSPVLHSSPSLRLEENRLRYAVSLPPSPSSPHSPSKP
ncbi:hypothetical protein ACLOJK_013038 [Asimina triloba]